MRLIIRIVATASALFYFGCSSSMVPRSPANLPLSYSLNDKEKGVLIVRLVKTGTSKTGLNADWYLQLKKPGASLPIRNLHFKKTRNPGDYYLIELDWGQEYTWGKVCSTPISCYQIVNPGNFYLYVGQAVYFGEIEIHIRDESNEKWRWHVKYDRQFDADLMKHFETRHPSFRHDDIVQREPKITYERFLENQRENAPIEFGCLKGTCVDGFSLFNSKDGYRYEGQFKAGKFHGKGKWIGTNGLKYEGEWQEGIISGKGTLHFNTITNLEAEILKPKRQYAKGRFNHWNGGRYYGELFVPDLTLLQLDKHDKPERLIKRNGLGMFIRYNDQIIKGKWKNNKLIQHQKVPGVPESFMIE